MSGNLKSGPDMDGCKVNVRASLHTGGVCVNGFSSVPGQKPIFA